MPAHIDYYFTPISPWTYLGGERFEEIARRHGATVRYKPIDLGRVFPATGGLPLAKRAPERQNYRFVEMKRWADFLNMPLNFRPKFFPVPDALAACAIIAADERGVPAGPFVNALMRAVWAEERDISDPETVAAIAQSCGIGADLLDDARRETMTQRRTAYTEEAIALGVFGSPSYVLNEEIFWGQDRLDFLDRALARTDGTP